MNWGNKLLFAFLAFGAMIGYLVIRSFNTTYELVEPDYYNSEIAYQKVIDGNSRALGLETQLTVSQTADGVQLQLPAEMKNKAVKGKIWFYCDYNQKFDLHVDLQANAEGLQLIDKKRLAPGDYLVKTTWECEGKSYYAEKNLHVN